MKVYRNKNDFFITIISMKLTKEEEEKEKYCYFVDAEGRDCSTSLVSNHLNTYRPNLSVYVCIVREDVVVS
jgi:hypothetical protein